MTDDRSAEADDEDGTDAVDDAAEEAEETEEEPVADEESDEDDAEEESGLQDGDFVELDYTARTAENEQLVDTTDPELAEEEGAEADDVGPRTIVLGAGHLFPPVDEALTGDEVGDTGTVTVPPGEAFGEHDPDQVRTVSADKVDEDDRYPGAHVHIDGQHGYLETIIGGRARVDFNHPLAGNEIEYEYEILDVVEDREERAKGLLGAYVDLDLDVWIETDEVEEEVLVDPDEDDEDDEPAEPETELQTVEKETLYIDSDPRLAMNQQWMMQKAQIAQELTDRLDLDRVIVREVLGEGPGMMGGLGGMMGGPGGAGLEEVLEEADVDADEIVEELEGDEE